MAAPKKKTPGKKAPAPKAPPRAPAQGPKAKAPKAASSKATKAPAASAKGKKPSAPAPSKRAPKAAQDPLLALPPAFAAAIDFPVVDVVHEARDLEAVVDQLGERLVAGSRLDASLCASLKERRQRLESAEQTWLVHRLSQTSEPQQKTQQKAEQLKRDLIAALRYFLHGDEAAQARVDDIIPGTGLADLIDDLHKLAALARDYAAELRRADLPPRPAALASQLAEELGASGTSTLSHSAEGERLQELRNRAFWWLREAMDEIRAAGRYVYRNDPKKLVLFRASSTRARKHPGKAAKARKARKSGDPTK